jgi:multiple antibiotic resistance protein
MESFWLSFIQLFFTFNAFGIVSIFMALTNGIEPPRVRRILFQSIITAAGVALLFLAIGIAVLRTLGISVADFMVAGGVVLVIFAITELWFEWPAQSSRDPESLGAVPLGVPIITGPAVLTTSILSMNQYGFVVTALAIVANVLVVGVVFFFSENIIRILGRAGTKIIAKLSNLLLAAIGVMMVHKGIVAYIAAR